MSSAYTRAIQLLAQREYSEKELRKKLCLKQFSMDQIDLAIKELKSHNFLNDRRFAEAFTYFKSNKGYGPVHILYHLQQHHIPNPEYYINEIDWEACILKIYNKRMRHQDKILTSTEYNKHFRFFMQRGFPTDLIKNVLKNQTIR